MNQTISSALERALPVCLMTGPADNHGKRWSMATTEAILEMMELVAEQAKVLTHSVPIALNSPALDVSNAEQLLSYCVRYLAGVDRLYEAIEQAVELEAIDDDLQGSASEVADACHATGLALQNDVFEKILHLGGNANQMLSGLHDKYYPD